MEKSITTSQGATLLAGIGIDAALMYFLDPARGRGRVTRLRDQARSVANDAAESLDRSAQDLRQRARGTAAELRTRARDLSGTETPDDVTLVARVRAELGHHVEQPRAIEVVADGGRVTLRGRVPETDLPAVLATVRAVPGVREVDNRLDTA
jgi:osmotically-inducible protein OsmY